MLVQNCRAGWLLVRRTRSQLGGTLMLARHKIIYSEAFLDRAERLKLWNTDSKLLCGSLIDHHHTNHKALLPKESRKKVPKVMKFDELRKITLKPSSECLQNFKKAIQNKKAKSVSEKLEEIICIEKEILPTTNLRSHNHSNLISVTNKSGKQRIDIMTPNVKNNLFSNSFMGVPSIIIRNLKLFPMLNNQKMVFADNKIMDNPDDKILKIPSDGDVSFTKFPSVTRILEQTMSEEAKASLEKWKQEKIAELGLEGFERFNRAQLDKGIQFHELISQHFLSKFGVSNIDNTLEGVWSSVTPLLKGISSPKAIESHVLHPVLKYRGVIDCIAMYQDKPTLIEWKKSDKPKPTLSKTYDNPVQLAAYFGAISHDTNYKQLNVRDALLVIAYTDGSPADAFHLNADKMRQHWAEWLTRLERYWTANEAKQNPVEMKS